MRKGVILIFIYFILIQGIIADAAQIKGVVKDYFTKETLIGTKVFVQGTNLSAITGYDGSFIFENLTSGEYNLVFNYYMYEQKIERIVIGKEKLINLDISLKPVNKNIKNPNLARIYGVVKDSKSKESLVGTNIVIQGTSVGTVTDIDGKFELANIEPGNYNLVFSFLAYNKKIERVNLKKGQNQDINVELEPSSVDLQDIVITGVKKTGTEISLINTIKNTTLIATGISNQIISKSQDKDASEVVRRIPGITIVDGRFVVVRGLTERYNSVWMNNSSTPSSESDNRAFSFDVLPSSMIDNILIYKTPAPELPADFAGAAIQLFTKNNADKNSFSVTYQNTYKEGTSFNDFYTYKGGKNDWLGFDDGTRALPKNVPVTAEMDRLSEFNGTEDEINAKKDQITSIGKSFNKIWTPDKVDAFLDQSLTATLTRRMVFKNISIGNITCFTYSNNKDYDKMVKADYESYDTVNDRKKYSYDFIDNHYTNNIRLGLIHNWSFIFGNNQKIEFRNFYNHDGLKKTIIREGKEYYYGSEGSSLKNTELSFNSRTTYTGQLSGQHKSYSGFTQFDWTLGYAFANRQQPDIRRITTTLNTDQEDDNYLKYFLYIPKDAAPEMTGRLFLKTDENIINANGNFSHQFFFGSFEPFLKAGYFFEKKQRNFSARNLGFTQARTSQFNINLFQPVDSIFLDENINYTNGIRIDEKTSPKDSYDAFNELIAAYIALKIPVTKKINIYGGVRAEKNKRELSGFYKDNSINHDIKSDTINIFPSISLSYNITANSALKLAYGKTINRPEFREIAPFSFYDFGLNATIYGNDSLKDAIIDNFDIRWEWYPSPNEMVTFGAFYKKFKNPIEMTLFPAGNGWDYRAVNADASVSKWVEMDIRKSFANISETFSFLKFLENFTLLFNASLIKSEITTNFSYLKDKTRPMQGQSPYIINAGIFYQNEKKGLMFNTMYNVIGERIFTVGNPLHPHIYEMPHNLVDITVSKRFNEHFQIKLGIKDLLNETITFKQEVEFDQVLVKDGVQSSKTVKRDQINKSYRPGRSVSIGLTYSL